MPDGIEIILAVWTCCVLISWLCAVGEMDKISDKVHMLEQQRVLRSIQLLAITPSAAEVKKEL